MNNLQAHSVDDIVNAFSRKRMYLATPYTHTNKVVMQYRFELISFIAGDLTAKNQWVYSPITHGHTLGRFKVLPAQFDFWQAHCLGFLENWAEVLLIANIESWQESTGVIAEYKQAKQLNIPVALLDARAVLDDNFLELQVGREQFNAERSILCEVQ